MTRHSAAVLAGLVAVSLVNAACTGPGPTARASMEAPRGAWLGMTPPGDEPAIFAPGFVNRGLYTRDMAVMPDLSEFYWSVNVGNNTVSAILTTRMMDGEWSPPEVTSFSRDARWSNLEPAITPDGSKLYFASNRPVDGGTQAADHHTLWVVRRNGMGWSDPHPVSSVINDGSANFFPSPTTEGTLYFTRDLPDGGSAIFRSRFVEGAFVAPERLPEQINSKKHQFNAFVAPDESYLIVPVYGRDDSLGATDYYIVFRNEDDTFTGPVSLGEKINTSGGVEYSPYVSPDGKYFFFMSSRRSPDLPSGDLTASLLHEMHNTPGNGLPSVWWVDASFLQKLRPETAR